MAKGFAIILAVVGHAFPDCATGFWMAGRDSAAASMETFIYSFHMALLFVCSGFLLEPKLIRGGRYATQIWKRCKRLMTPYLFMSLVYLGGKVVAESIAATPLEEHALLGILLGNSPCFGGWFLWTLFVMSVMMILLRRIDVRLLLVVFFAISLIPVPEEHSSLLSGIIQVKDRMVWLVLGCVVSKYYGRICQHITWRACAVACGMALCMHLYGRLPEDTPAVLAALFKSLKTIAGITMGFSLCYLIAKHWAQTHTGKALQLCGDYCMDIYILSMFCFVPLRTIYVSLGAKEYIPYYPWTLLVTLTGVVVPIMVSKYVVRRNKMAGILLLGRYPK